MKTLRHILTLVLVMMSLASCYNYRQVGFVQDRKKLPAYDSIPYEEYRLKVNDQLSYRLITTNEDMAKLIGSNQSMSNGNNMMSYRVYPDGTVDFPYCSHVRVLGLTLDSAERVVEKAFREFLPDAEIKLALYNRTFTVIGDAGTGVHYIPQDRLTIYQALAISGDLKQTGDRAHVRIIRNNLDGKAPQVLEFDIRPNTVINSEYYYVYPNDLIYVQRAKGSFVKMSNYSSFIGIITSSISLLVSVFTYVRLFK